MIFAVLLSALKKSLARLLVLIVSMGYGVVKPTLGATMRQVLMLGAGYFIASSAYDIAHVIRITQGGSTRAELVFMLPLSLLDAVIVWWVFISLSKTMNTLRLRKQVVKLSMYQYFMYTLLFCIVASIIFVIVWVSLETSSSRNWKVLWLNEAYWPILFLIILVAIMILWRPNKNTNRYAYTALDEEDPDVEAQVAQDSGAYGDIKLRNLGRSDKKKRATSADDDDDTLKWVEENIASTSGSGPGASAIPSFDIDDEEEIMNTRLELSKMD
eukprot:Colp12_sorted_trinity150504_noHs@11885